MELDSDIQVYSDHDDFRRLRYIHKSSIKETAEKKTICIYRSFWVRSSASDFCRPNPYRFRRSMIPRSEGNGFTSQKLDKGAP